MLNVKIATPDQKIFDGNLEEIIIQTTVGVITVLPNHVPFISTIEDGYVKFNNEQITISKGTVILSENNALQVLGIIK